MNASPATAPVQHQSDAPPPDQKDTLAAAWRSPLVQESLTPLGFLVVFVVYWLWLGERFVDPDGRLLDVHQNTAILLLGLAVLVTLIAGQFDLSVASVAALTNFLIIGLPSQEGWPFALALAACIAIGLVVGLVNGLLVAGWRVNTFIATLGTGGIALGLSAVYSRGTTVVPGAESQPPSWFTGPGSLGDFTVRPPNWLLWGVVGAAVAWFAARYFHELTASFRERRVRGVAVAVLAVAAIVTVVIAGNEWIASVSTLVTVVIATAFIVWLVIERTVFGRHLRATGSNAEAAKLAGVRTTPTTIGAFVIGGGIAAFAGVMFAASQGSAAPNTAVTFLLPGFAAAFLSTVIFSAGTFKVWGTILGGVFLAWVAQGLIVGGVPFTWVDVVNGLVLLLAVALATVRRRA